MHSLVISAGACYGMIYSYAFTVEPQRHFWDCIKVFWLSRCPHVRESHLGVPLPPIHSVYCIKDICPLFTRHEHKCLTHDCSSLKAWKWHMECSMRFWSLWIYIYRIQFILYYLLHSLRYRHPIFTTSYHTISLFTNIFWCLDEHSYEVRYHVGFATTTFLVQILFVQRGVVLLLICTVC